MGQCCAGSAREDLLPAMDFKEQAKNAIEDQMANAAPGGLKICFPCCGGPVGTLEKFTFMVPAGQRDTVNSAIAKYKTCEGVCCHACARDAAKHNGLSVRL